ncbi:M23 family metallopeptidase [Rheinheimera muenzenbergensis]|uniref:M23 family metallopeptidase n=1 Tax=Rheinheimera muenzenbergensis TaxID=1193628 RepID=A0ABU8CCJ5_9GAMM
MRLTNLLLYILLSINLSVAAVATEKYSSLNHSLIYSYEEMFNFDIEAYLANQAPHLLPYAEVISHWSGYSSISPRVLLALIEQQSGLLTQQQVAAAVLETPFGKLSDKRGFAEQFQDVADKLANLVYTQSKQEGIAEFTGQIDPRLSGLDILFTADNTQAGWTELEIQQLEADKVAFTELYYRLFRQEYLPFKRQPDDKEMQVQAPNGFLQFPFPLGQSWHIGGAHTNTGSGSYPLSSLDMSMGGGWGSNQYNTWVSASAAGQFKRHSSCFAEIVHANGWSTTYYHLMNIQHSTGATVNKNSRVANPANTRGQALCNGGQSTGPHQHWSLKRNGSWYHLNGAYLSGWRITAIGYSYDTNCNRFYLSKNGWWGCAGYYRH